MSSSPLLALSAAGGNDSGANQTSSAPVPRPRVRWTTRVVLPAGIVLGIAAVLTTAVWSTLMPALEVTVEPAVLKTVSATRAGTVMVQAAGWVESDPYLIQITALTSGVVADILVLEGDAVTAGQPMARLVADDAHLSHRRRLAELRLQQAAVTEAEARLAAALATWDHPIGRDRHVAVNAAALDEIRTRILRQQAELQRQQIVLDQAERTLRRFRALGETRVVPVADVEDAETAWQSSVATLEVLRQALSEALAAEKRQEAELHAARRNRELRIEERREVDEARAALARAQAQHAVAETVAAEAALQVERLEIRAPRDGIVVNRYKEPGDRVMLGGDGERAATLFSLYDPRSLQVRIDIPLADAAKIAVGQPCEVICDVLPEHRFAGQVTRILHQADIQKNTLQVKVALHDPAPELRPEMLARARFLAADKGATDDAATAVFAPADTLANGRVWVVAAFDGRRGTAQPRNVQSNGEHDGWIQVNNVYPGDLLIRVPGPGLRPGQRVRPVN